MKPFAKKIIGTLTVLIGLMLAIFYIIKDPEPTILMEIDDTNQFIKIEDLSSTYDKKGSFKLALSFQVNDSIDQPSFLGVKINTLNDSVDEVRVGINNQNSLTLALLKNNEIIETAETNVKLPLNKSLNLFVTYQANQKDITKSNENSFSISVCEGIGFFGDLANLRLSLNGYTKALQPYSIETINSHSDPIFQKASLSVWKDYESFD